MPELSLALIGYPSGHCAVDRIATPPLPLGRLPRPASAPGLPASSADSALGRLARGGCARGRFAGCESRRTLALLTPSAGGGAGVGWSSIGGHEGASAASAASLRPWQHGVGGVAGTAAAARAGETVGATAVHHRPVPYRRCSERERPARCPGSGPCARCGRPATPGGDAVSRAWRSKAASTARSEAVVMLGLWPRPHLISLPRPDRFDVGDRLRVRAAADGMFGVVDDVEIAVRRSGRSSRGDERLDRAVTLALHRDRRRRRPSSWAVSVVRPSPSLDVVCNSWVRSRNRGSAGRYSDWNVSHMRDRADLGAGVLGVVLDHLRELDLEPPRQVEAVLLLHHVRDAALARLGVDADDRLVRAADVVRVDRQIRDAPGVVVVGRGRRSPS